jgi:thiamine biosynthesis lipoprotein
MKRIFYYLLSTAFLCGCQNKPVYKETRVLMGTFVEVTSASPDACAIVFREIQRIEDSLSKYKGDSEISKLNRSGKLKVSPDTYYILKKSQEFWRLSDGAFDITVGPLLDVWGFTDKNYRLPSSERIKNALARVGFEKIIFDDTDSTVTFKIPQMKIDLGAIAKGYAVDCAVKKLKASGIANCLINAGGQVYGLGDNLGKPWNIGLKNPRGNSVLNYLKLKDQAVSTSGDYEQYFIRTKKRYSHIFNPKTGYPADSDIISVTVLARDGLTSDALSTSIFVLGKKKGEELAKKFPDVKVTILEKKDVSDN